MRSAIWRGLVFAPATLALVALACRDEVRLFQPEPRPLGRTANVRLTYSPGNDRAPAWSLGGDTVYYTAEAFAEFGGGPGVLLGVPSPSGPARQLLLNVQSAGVRAERWLVSPVPDPAGSRLAFAEIVDLWEPHPCSLRGATLSCQPTRSEEQARLPPLRRIAIRVRHFDATQPIEEDPSLVFVVPGVTRDFEGVATAVVHAYPFQLLFAADSAFTFRASWSPAGERLVFSDGLRLLTWTVGEPEAQAVPGSEDGVWPAWSPDGAWIAFTRLARADSSGATCSYRETFTVRCVQERTEYLPGPHVLSVIRPDGSERLELGLGDEPAWAADGAQLFFRRDGQIWRSAPDGSGAQPVPGTEGGREPAVSPDGRTLAIAKLNVSGDYDIWTVSLAP